MVRLYLVTANIGSIFDNMETGVPIWMSELTSVVRSKNPEFVAIHFQETGGKSYVNGSEEVQIFVTKLIDQMKQINFRVAEAFVDSNSDLDDQFTALSSIYFIHESYRLPVYIWDFQDGQFCELPAARSSTNASLPNNVFIGPVLDQTHRKQKEKFPQHFYPNCKWSRKGFLRTRWRFGKTIVDLVNIHLFHDSCNLLAANAFPSQFAQHREKTLRYTIDRIQSDGLEKSPLFIFGDFNFRLNAPAVLDILKKDYGDIGDHLSDMPIILGTKRFHCPDQERRFKHSFEWLKKYDFESKQVSNMLQEYDLNFHPTYPFEEELDEPETFHRTRLPAWCDRVLYTPSTKEILSKDFPIDYGVIGSKAYMGDHKPVYLVLEIKTDDHPPLTLNSTKDTTTPTNENSISGKSKSDSPLDLALSSKMILPSSLCKNCANNYPSDATILSYATRTENPSCHLENNAFVAKLIPYESLSNGDGICSSSYCSTVAQANFILDDTKSSTLESSSSSVSPTECKCFSAFRRRGKMRMSKNRIGSSGGGFGGGGDNKKRAFGFALPFKRGGSGSLLEPITSAACDPPCSSVPSSCTSSKRPSIAIPRDTNDPFDGTNPDFHTQLMSTKNVDFFTASNPTKWNKLGKDYCWKCAPHCDHLSSPISPLGQLSNPEIPVGGGNICCPNHCTLLMNLAHNYQPVVVSGNFDKGLTDANSSLVNNKHIEDCIAQKKRGSLENPLGANLFIALNGNANVEKKISDKSNGNIPISWKQYDNNCECVMNSKNSMKTSGHNKLQFNITNSSASHGTNGGNCKCQLKHGMRRTGGCVSCSKCVIL